MAPPTQANGPPVTSNNNSTFVDFSYAPRESDEGHTVYGGSSLPNQGIHSGLAFPSSAGPSIRNEASTSAQISDDVMRLGNIPPETSLNAANQRNDQGQTGELDSSPRGLVEHDEHLRVHAFIKELQFVEVGALLIVLCIIAMFQGGTRFLDAHAMSQSDICFKSTFALVQGIFEICFSTIDFMIGLAVLTRRDHNRVITKFIMAPQALVSVYVLLYHFFPFSADQIIAPAVHSTPYDDRYSNMVNTFISLQLYLSLNGGIFFFMARLVSLSTRHIPNKTFTEKLLDRLSSTVMGGIVWNFNLFLFGTWVLIKGCLSRQGISIITGILIISCAIWGMIIASGHAQPTNGYYLTSENMILLSVLTFAVETAQNGSSRIVLLQGFLIFTTTFLGMYAGLSRRQQEQRGMEEGTDSGTLPSNG